LLKYVCSNHTAIDQNHDGSGDDHGPCANHGAVFLQKCLQEAASNSTNISPSNLSSNSNNPSFDVTIDSITTVEDNFVIPPSLEILEKLAAVITFFCFYNTGTLSQFPQSPSPTHSLAVFPLYPKSLNATHESSEGYHWLLRTASLHGEDKTTTLQIIPVGRIWFEQEPTFWIVVVDLQGRLYALRADEIAEEELTTLDEEDMEDNGTSIVPTQKKSMFDEMGVSGKKLKAVSLGGLSILEGDLCSCVSTFKPLHWVTSWESESFDLVI
jgi:hypothetical protein